MRFGIHDGPDLVVKMTQKKSLVPSQLCIRSKLGPSANINNALAKAITMVSIDDICGWFAHCGYVFSFE